MPWTETQRIIAEQPSRIDLRQFYRLTDNSTNFGTFAFTAGWTPPTGVTLAAGRYLDIASNVSPGYKETPLKLTYTPPGTPAPPSENADRTLVTLTPYAKLRAAQTSKNLISEVYVAGIDLTQRIGDNGLTFSVQIDETFLNQFTASDLKFSILDTDGDFSPTGNRNAFTQKGFHPTGYNAPVRAAIGYSTPNGDITRTRFCGTVTNVLWDASTRTATFHCLNRLQTLNWKDFEDFGRIIEDTLNAANFSVPESLQPLSNGSVKGTDSQNPARDIIPVNAFKSTGIANPLHMKQAADSIQFETYGGPYPITAKVAWRSLTRREQILKTLQYLGIDNYDVNVDSATVSTPTIQQVASPVQQLIQSFAAAAAAVRDWHYDSVTGNFYMLLCDVVATAQTQDRLIRFNPVTQQCEVVETLTRGDTHDSFVIWWGTGARQANATPTFFVMGRRWNMPLSEVATAATPRTFILKAGTTIKVTFRVDSGTTRGVMGNIKQINNLYYPYSPNALFVSGDRNDIFFTSYNNRPDVPITSYESIAAFNTASTNPNNVIRNYISIIKPNLRLPRNEIILNTLLVATEFLIRLYCRNTAGNLVKCGQDAVPNYIAGQSINANKGVIAGTHFGTTDILVYQNDSTVTLAVVLNASLVNESLNILKTYPNVWQAPFVFWQDDTHIYWIEGFPYAIGNYTLTDTQRNTLGYLYKVPLTNPTSAAVASEGIVYDTSADLTRGDALAFAGLANPEKVGDDIWMFLTNGSPVSTESEWFTLKKTADLEKRELIWHTNGVNTRDEINRFAREELAVWYLDTERFVFKSRQHATAEFHSFDSAGTTLRYHKPQAGFTDLARVTGFSDIPETRHVLLGDEVIRYTGTGTETVESVVYQTLTGCQREYGTLVPERRHTAPHLHARGETLTFVHDVLDDTEFDNAVLAVNQQTDKQFHLNTLEITTAEGETLRSVDIDSVAKIGENRLVLETGIEQKLQVWLSHIQTDYFKQFGTLTTKLNLSIFPRYALQLADTVYLRLTNSGIMSLAQIYGISYERDSMTLSLKSVPTPGARRWELAPRSSGGRYIAFDKSEDNLYFGDSGPTGICNRVLMSVLTGAPLQETNSRIEVQNFAAGRRSNGAVHGNTLYVWDSRAEKLSRINMSNFDVIDTQFGTTTPNTSLPDDFTITESGDIWVEQTGGSTGMRMVKVTPVSNPSLTNLMTKDVAGAVEIPANVRFVYSVDGETFYGIRTTDLVLVSWRRVSGGTASRVDTRTYSLPGNISDVRGLERGRACWYLHTDVRPARAFELWMLPDSESGFTF